MKCKGIIKAHIEGGFGNQLFQVSNALNLAYLNQIPVSFIDIGAKEPKLIENIFNFRFNLSYKFNGSKLENLDEEDHASCIFSTYKENQSCFEKIDLKSNHTLIFGYFQSVLYFLQIENYLNNLFSQYISQKKMLNEIAVHVRLGDYLKRRNKKIYVQQSVEYFKSGIEFFKEKYDLKNPKITFFTNDIVEFHSRFIKIFNSYHSEICSQDTMKSFKNLLLFQNIVISNSTFSWWAAWACKASTVAPLEWYSQKSGLIYDDDNFISNNWFRI